MHPSKVLRTVVLALCLMAIACQNPPPNACVMPASSAKIVNGNLDTANTFMAVACEGGGQNPDGSTNPCASATLIAPGYVLTAHHIGFSVGRPLWFGAQPRTNPDFGVTAVRCWEFRNSGPAACCDHVPPSDPTYPQYLASCPQPLAANDYVLTDLAVWELNREVTEVAPIPIALTTPKGSNILTDLTGTQAVFVGLGSTDNCSNPTTLSGTRRWGSVWISGATQDYYQLNGAGQVAGNIPSMLAAQYVTSWPYTAPGDSGGPLLVNYGPAPASGACSPLAQFKIVGIATQGCNYSFGSTLYPGVAAGLRQVLGSALVE